MKVLVFMPQFYKLGGAERLDISLAIDLNKAGIHTDILSMYTDCLPGVERAHKNLLMEGIPSLYYLGMKINPPFTSFLPAIRKLKEIMIYGGYDFLTTSGVSTTVLGSWASLGASFRQVAGIHRTFFVRSENSLQHIFFRFSARVNRRIVYYAISKSVAEAWISYSGIKSSKLKIIYNAINDDLYKAKSEKLNLCHELGIPEDARIVLNVGRFAKIKGTDTLIEALGPILKHHHIYLLLAGTPDWTVEGTPDLINNIKSYIKNNKLSKWIHFLGFRSDIPMLMASSDVLVHPTRREGFGLVLAEAMAAGLPIVSSNVEGIPEVLDGTDSIMVPPNNPRAIRNAILDILNGSPDDIANTIQKGRHRAERYRLINRTEAMIGLFNGLAVTN